MLRLTADENLDGRIVRGLQRALPELDMVRVQDTPLKEANDDSVLEWAAREGRVVVTHDVTTMTAAAWARVERGQPMAGVIEVSTDEPTGRAIDEIRLIVVLCAPEEMEGQVLFLPL
jgi:predicted nuclease of predicted toxin-antitoxin system